MKSAVFIGATGQHVGKTTCCLGLVAALKHRFGKVGFIKPVGQRHISLAGGVHIDKDVALFKEYFGIHSEYKEMSPVLIPKGFTREYLDQKIAKEDLESDIKHAFERVTQDHQFTVVEGTGHIGVGSIIDLDNARVAQMLGLDMVIIGSGGLGSAFDELTLNIGRCKQAGVAVRGVILNRVIESKREMIQEYFQKALDRWNIPLIGCIPFNEMLTRPTMADFETLFNTELITGKDKASRHFRRTRLVATSLESYQELIEENQLIITPATREDIIMETLEKHMVQKVKYNHDLEGGMILTGRKPPREEIIRHMDQLDLPIIYAPVRSYEAMQRITSFIAKIRKDNPRKIQQAIDLIRENVDLDLLIGSKGEYTLPQR